MATDIEGGLQGRIGLTVYYSFVWVLAVRRCISTLSGRGFVNELSYWHVALYAALAFSSWLLLGHFQKTSDRIAALLYGLFYSIRVGIYFVKGVEASLPVIAECTIISAGMIAMIVGLKRSISQKERGNSHP